MGSCTTNNIAAHGGQERADSPSVKCVSGLQSSRRRLKAGQALVFVAVLSPILLAALDRSSAADGRGRGGPSNQGLCLVEVLRSEELPLAPPFHHTVKATLLVTPPDRPPFETTVLRVIPWQSPPPRQGQRVWVSCDPALIKSSLRLF